MESENSQKNWIALIFRTITAIKIDKDQIAQVHHSDVN